MVKQNMIINVGSKNPTKIQAVKQIFKSARVMGTAVDSLVSSQPLSDLETKEGAINRAIAASEQSSGVLGIGLEGGVMKIANELYLCNWGALAGLDDQIFVASGARIPLPEEIKIALSTGKELGDVMDAYKNRQGIRNKEGAIGIFTNSFINRSEMFAHIVQLLYGQSSFYKA